LEAVKVGDGVSLGEADSLGDAVAVTVGRAFTTFVAGFGEPRPNAAHVVNRMISASATANHPNVG
jgi:hypothetical protein